MTIFIISASVLILTALVWIVTKITTLHICPICAGVSLTWLMLLAGMAAGVLPTASVQLPAALLMGGSVVGIAGAIEKKWHIRQSLALKTIFITVGFGAAYSLVSFQLVQSAILILAMTLIAYLQIHAVRQQAPKDVISANSDRFSDCC